MLSYSCPLFHQLADFKFASYFSKKIITFKLKKNKGFSMGLMTSMRERMHVVLWALLAMFLLSMTIGGLVGGANIIDQLIGRVNPQTTIAQINNKNISPDVYNNLVNQQVENARSSGRPINDFILQRARDTAWDNLIQDVLVTQEVERLGITATDEEVIFHLKNNPPPFLQQNPSFQTNNIFDIKKYRQALATPQGNEWGPIESFMKNTYIPNFKLQKIVDESIIISDLDIKEEFIKRNLKYTISTVHVTPSRVSKQDTKPTNEEISSRYLETKNEYKHDGLRSIRYVLWKKEPSNSDTTNTQNLAKELYNRAQSGEDFSSLANEYSMDPGNEGTKGGDLGWFKKGRMVKEFEKAAFASKKDKILPPITSDFGFHIIYVKDSRVDANGVKEVLASHILLKIDTSPTTLSNLKRDVTLFSYDAQDNSFETALSNHGLSSKVQDKLNINDYSVVGVGGLRSAVRFAFNNKLNDVSDILENDQYFVICKIEKITLPGFKPISDVEKQIEISLNQEKIKAATLDVTNDFLITLSSPNMSISKMLSPEEGVDVIKEDIKTLSQGFTSIGKSNQITGAVLNSEIGDLLGPLETSKGYSLVQVLKIADFDSVEYVIQRDIIKNSLFTRRQNQYFQAWLNDLKKNSDIIDNRKYYF